MKVSTLKKNPSNPQTYENSGFNGIIDVCERHIIANNVTSNFIAQERVRSVNQNIVRGSVSVSHRDTNPLAPSSQSQRLVKTLGTKVSGQANSRLSERTGASRNHIGKGQTVRRGAVAFQPRTNLSANPLNIENGGGKCLLVMIGLVKNADSEAGVYTPTTLNHLPITKNSVLMFPTVERFANPVISKPTLMGARL